MLKNKFTWLVVSLAGIAGLLCAAAPWGAGASTSVVRLMASREAANGAVRYTGSPYIYGGTSPAGFDCSGFAQFIYKNYVGVAIPRTAEDQYHFFRSETKAHAWGGDLVFFHDSSGFVFHVGIYEGGSNMVSALSPQYGVRWSPLSWGEGDYVTYGTVSH